jgi:CheY-like chemotaxis protein
VVLIVEDDELVREIGASVLTDAGYLVIEADGANQALAALEAGTEIHLMFTDIQMPGDMDGLQLAHIVSVRWPMIHLLISSGQVLPTRGAMPQGGRYLSKPYTAAEVLRHVGELVAA